MSKRLARRGLIVSLLIMGALILGAVWVTYDAYRRESLRIPLIRAVKQNDAVQVQRLLSQGADPDAQDDSRTNFSLGEFLRGLLRPRRPVPSASPTALMLAAQNRRLRIAELLVQRGADVNKQTGNGSSALYWAAANDSPEIVRLLLDRGARPDVMDQSKTTPLIACAGNPDTVQALLDHGANVNAVNVIGMTALMIAAQCSNLKSVQLLAEHGANVNAVRKGGGTALLDAVSMNLSDSSDVIEYLIDHGADLEAVNHNGETALFVACHPNGDKDSVRLLLEHGAKVNVRNRHGDMPLHEAVGNVEYDEEPGSPEVVRLLLAHGADPNIKNRLGYTPLMKTPKASPDIRRLLQAAKH